MQSRSSTPHLALLFVCMCFCLKQLFFLMNFISARSEIICFAERLLAREFFSFWFSFAPHRCCYFDESSKIRYDALSRTWLLAQSLSRLLNLRSHSAASFVLSIYYSLTRSFALCFSFFYQSFFSVLTLIERFVCPQTICNNNRCTKWKLNVMMKEEEKTDNVKTSCNDSMVWDWCMKAPKNEKNTKQKRVYYVRLASREKSLWNIAVFIKRKKTKEA